MRLLRLHLLLFITFLTLCMSFCGPGDTNNNKPARGQWDFQLKKAWEAGQFGSYLLARPRKICLSEEGKVFIWDKKYMKMFVCDSLGKYLYDFGKKGEGPGELLDTAATRVNLINNYIFIHEINRGLVHYFSLDGTYETTKRISPISYSHALRTFLSPSRMLIFLSEERGEKKEHSLGIYDIETGSFKEIANPSPDKPLYLSEGNVSLQIPDISAINIFAHFRGEKIYYGRNDKYAITGLDLTTDKKISISLPGRKGREISPATKKKKAESYYFFNDRQKKLLEEKLPGRTLFFNRISVNKKGLIYVFVPNWEAKNSYEIDIFSPNGDYLYQSLIKIPDDYSAVKNLTFNGAELYFIAEDSQGEIKLVKFDITPPSL